MRQFKRDDVIAAIATPLGEGAISIVRMSGKGCVELAERIFRSKKGNRKLSENGSHRMTLGYIVDAEGRVLDEVLLCAMRAPHSYTREDVVEIHCHGGIAAARSIFELLVETGARVAEPGEFTKRAFLNGRIDLAQAEAVLEIIRSRSRRGVDFALKQLSGELSKRIGKLREELKGMMAAVEAEIDFPEEVEEQERVSIIRKLDEMTKKIENMIGTSEIGRIYREGLATVIIGKPNTGKSTLLNRLLGEERALVTEMPGTTRDVIEECIAIKGIPIRLLDTAGIREKAERLERMGIERTRETLDKADIALVMFDATTPLEDDDRRVMEEVGERMSIILLNKIDAVERRTYRKDLEKMFGEKTILEISARRGWGMEELKDKIAEMVEEGRITRESPVITNARHKEVLEKTKENLSNALEATRSGMPMECVALDLSEAWQSLGEITGESIGEEIIDRIFEDFCVGK